MSATKKFFAFRRFLRSKLIPLNWLVTDLYGCRNSCDGHLDDSEPKRTTEVPSVLALPGGPPPDALQSRLIEMKPPCASAI